MQLNEIIKNLKLTSELRDQIQKNTLNQFVIFECDDFVLLDEFVSSLCVEILGEKEKVLARSHPDLLFFPTDERKGLVVEDVEKIIDQSAVRPLEGDRKVFVIKNTGSISAVVQNKLLKTLEEPNRNVFYFLLTRFQNGILPTIRSRGLKIRLEKLNKTQFTSLGLSDEEFVIYGGSLEKKQNEFKNGQLFRSCREALIKLKSSEDLLYVARVLLNKSDIEQIIDNFSTIFSAVVAEKTNPSGVFEDVANLFYIESISGIFEALDSARQKVKFNCNPQAILDCLLLKILEEKAKWTKRK